MKKTDSGCEACPLDTTRRTFLREILGAAASALIAVGVAPLDAFALPPSFIDSSERRGSRLSYPIPQADGVSIDKRNDVILVRWHSEVFAFNLACPHQNVALRWNDKAHRFKCPKHGSQYEPDGNFITGRATRGMDRFPIAREGDAVVVDTGTLCIQDKDRASWIAASVRIA